MTVWVDGDSCPRPVRAILERAAERRGISIVFVANRDLPAPGPAHTVVVEPPNTADDHILAVAAAGDLVITRDIPLAERVVQAGIACMNDRGTLFDAESIAQRRSERDRAMEIRAAAGISMNPRSYGKRETKLFADAFDRFLSKHLLS